VQLNDEMTVIRDLKMDGVRNGILFFKMQKRICRHFPLLYLLPLWEEVEEGYCPRACS